MKTHEEVEYDIFIKNGRNAMFTDNQVDFLWDWFGCSENINSPMTKHEKEEQLGENMKPEEFNCGHIAYQRFSDKPVHISEEKKDWEESFNNLFEVARDYNLQFGLIESDIKNFIREKLKEEQDRHEEDLVLFRKHEIADLARARKEEREKWQLKNAGLYRQLFGETNNIYTSKDLWEIFDNYQPLFTEEQKKELKDNLNSIMKKK